MNRTFDFKETWLHKVNPSVKLIWLVALFIAVLFIQNPSFLLNFTFMLTVLLFCFSGHPAKRIWWITFPFLLISFSTATSMIFFGKGEELWFHWGLISITKESFYRGFHIGLRAFTFSVLGLLFSLTTRPVFLFYSLMQQLKLKPKYAYSFMAGIRLIPIMISEFQIIRSALKVRGVQKKSGLKGFYQTIKTYSVSLLSQSIRRAHRIAIAMEAKRFSAVQQRTYYYETTFSKFDILFVLSFLIILPIAYEIGMHLPYFPVTDVRG
ncbi:energy-coupling factor transporter transmembrane component T family protein [Falsibacillus albus]|uniref:Energy-coupling factor transporter transmembrane protein EcfT n=1 Tax=Falsibacillus albus TaxID=2478915 RepID=A0A3L7JUD3_9BACI|nr:energy-coupling factor transporter transmembrane component T [Falsibacillus albus]RLQ93221.1 energy-coupling factor transporter transmembrane protein EcfT [Falsibacillus albus]